MFLKRLELFGFKSFAEKSELSLEPGIAAIIGPNGCGKSNLVDAVRWALGEQSVKSLRGTKMEEIIFSGSESRKALNFAEVSLTFAGAAEFLNLEYDEITITRRLFRSGDSEYYINKSPCRLKDITELFLDTGLGKDVYSVIGQGRVDEIINSRPEERREIFEEAAGILKYKLRKKEAGRRLEETRDNLVRVEDLIYELGTQVEPLHEQAAVTREYKEIQGKIENEEKRLLSYRLNNSREELARVNRQLESVNDALFNTAAQGGLQEKEIHELKTQVADLVERKKAEEEKLNNLVRKQEQQDSELKLLIEREKHFQEQLEQNRSRLTRLEQLQAELVEQSSKAEENLANKNQELAELEELLARKREELSIHESSALSAEIERLQEIIYKAGARRDAASVSITELNRRLERITRQKTNLLEEQKKLKAELALSNDKSAGLKDKIQKIELDFGDNEAGLAKLNRLEEQKRNYYNRSLEEEQSLKEKLHGTQARLSLLREQDKALSGYYRGVKEIVQASPALPGIIGPVADLISVEPRYIEAVETALGNSLQYLVAESEQAVQKAIQYLKDGGRGWATFLPLDILHKPANPLERYPGWCDLPGVQGRASDLVKVNSSFRKAIDYLLSPILVCDSLQNAVKAARFLNHSCRVVTLEGEIINPGGIMRGGSLPKRSAGMPLGRRREIDDLENQEKNLKDQMEELRSKSEAAKKAHEKAVAAVKEKTDQALAISGELNEINRDYERALNEKAAWQNKIEAAEKELAELETEEAEINNRLVNLQEDLSSSGDEIKELEAKIVSLKSGHITYLDEKNRLEQQITEALVRVSACREQKENLLSRIEEIRSNREKPLTEKAERQNESEKYQNQLFENKKAQESLQKYLVEMNNEKAELMLKVEKIVEELNMADAALTDLEEKEKLRQSRMARQEKRERRLSVEQTRLQTEVNYQELRFKELFHSLELVQLEEKYNSETAGTLIENLKEDLEALGEVNLGAIEELARLEDRIKFLDEQKDDLLKGELSLNKILAEIDQRMEYYFTHAFEQINEYMGQTFLELFQGGQVMLKLTDPDHILDSGIEIAAQPPGKKLQNITLLSAGEKVLTAIALVFAILRFKPAPFYLLDEVESMLDDANLTRFTKFLKQNAEQAQFILITHRKRTMEEAGVLYGVTMPEPGVSRLMSLRLENNKIIGELN